jgi:hypothetical protein
MVKAEPLLDNVKVPAIFGAITGSNVTLYVVAVVPPAEDPTPKSKPVETSFRPVVAPVPPVA